MTDRESLELAAKAAGLEVWSNELPGDPESMATGGLYTRLGYWNPLVDDGDALRLMVDLGMRVYVYPDAGDDVTVVANDELRMKNAPHISEPHSSDKLAATRRAIVRAAAEIGKSMTA